jgi:Flp pilus assembly protein TadG
MLGLFRLPICLKRVIRDCSGGVMTYGALTLPILVGAAGLSVDVSSWHLHHKVLRASADAAATSGALELLRTGNAHVNAAATDAAGQNGFKSGEDTIVINRPPLSGSRAGSMDSVEVIITRQAPTILSGIISPGLKTIVARAVAFGSANDTCIWALNPNVSGAITVSGGAQVTIDCGMFVNSKNSSALAQSGTSCITATEAKIAGGYSGTCIEGTIATGVPPVEDPLSWVQAPSYSSCDVNNKVKVNAGQTLILDPGVYCGAIEVLAGGSLHFNPGLYVLNSAGLKFASSSTVTGYDVNFYISEFNGVSDTIDIAAGANVDLVAGDNGGLDGILFYHDRDAPSGLSHSITGGATMNLDGILYFPNQNVKFAGGSTSDATNSILIADTVTFTGNTEIGLTGSVVAANPLLISAKLAE